MTFIPSPQQKAVFDWTVNSNGNAFVQAVAGAGKTTTLIQTCGLINGSVVFLAYNKKIVEDIKSKLTDLSSNAYAATFHSVGFAAWRKFAPRVKVEKFREKNTQIFTTLEIPEQFHLFVSKAVSLAKQRALGVFGSIRDHGEWSNIVDRFDLIQELDKDTKVEDAIDWSIRALEASNALCKTLIDFDDMIYAPIFFGVRVDTYDFVLVDEAQDTNPSRRALARKLVSPTGRIVFVGDRHQAIYGFTGADSDAVDQIIRDFQCVELPLTVTYRCPKSVVKAAQGYVSHIQAHESAPEGKVETIDSLEAFADHYSKLTATDAILCRKTAPLIELAFKLIRKGIACHVEGRDIGAGLINMLYKWKRVKSVEDYLELLEAWQDKQIELLTAKGKEYQVDSLKDRVETIQVLCEGCETLKEVQTKINSLFADSDDERNTKKNLTLSTVHKAKGREWNNVYVFGYAKWMPSKLAKQAWQQEQETNLIYVALTRAKERLVLVG